MPSFRRVSFSDRNHYSRLPHDDELYVMKAFAKHADNCDSCYNPYKAYKDGSTLCPQGHQRALDVAQYVYSRGGQSFSQVDRERNQRVQIEIPANCEAVRLLLKAMDRGLRLMRRAPPTSYDRTYYVPARLSLPDNQRSMPATRPSTSHSSSRPSSSKTSISETLIAPRQSRAKGRSRSPSASSVSSAGSSAPRGSKPCFVRSRSKDGKRSHSPIFVRTLPLRSVSQSSTKKEPHPVSSNSHSRQGSTSSSSSRSSSIFSRSSSRNSSISSQSSFQEYPVPSAAASAPALSNPKIAFRKPEYQEPNYQTIAPKNSASPPASPIRSRSRHSK